MAACAGPGRRSPRSRPRPGHLFTCTPTATAAASRSASPRPSSTTKRTAGEAPREPGLRGTGQARQHRAPAGLLERLMAAVRPEFRAKDLVRPAGPGFGGPPCAVSGCDRPHRRQGLCTSHWQRWQGSGQPSLAEFTATAEPGWHGHLPLDSCVIAGCNYGAMGHGMCQRHLRQWHRAGRPGLEDWRAPAAPLPPGGPPPACRIGYCSLWTRGTSVFCYGHDIRWKDNGRPDIDEFAASCENPGPGQEHIDLRRLPAGLRLEMQYVLQCRGDERDAKLPPREVHPLVAALAAAGASSLLEQPEEWWAALDAPGNGRGWRPFILDARRRIEALAFGAAGTPSTRGTSGGSATWASISPRPPSASRPSPSPGTLPRETPAGSWPRGYRPAQPGPGPGP